MCLYIFKVDYVRENYSRNASDLLTKLKRDELVKEDRDNADYLFEAFFPILKELKKLIKRADAI